MMINMIMRFNNNNDDDDVNKMMMVVMYIFLWSNDGDYHRDDDYDVVDHKSFI